MILVSKQIVVEGEVWNVADVRLWRTKITVRSWDLNLTQGYRSQQEFNKIRFTFCFFLRSVCFKCDEGLAGDKNEDCKNG